MGASHSTAGSRCTARQGGREAAPAGARLASLLLVQQLPAGAGFRSPSFPPSRRLPPGWPTSRPLKPLLPGAPPACSDLQHQREKAAQAQCAPPQSRCIRAGGGGAGLEGEGGLRRLSGGLSGIKPGSPLCAERLGLAPSSAPALPFPRASFFHPPPPMEAGCRGRETPVEPLPSSRRAKQQRAQEQPAGCRARLPPGMARPPASKLGPPPQTLSLQPGDPDLKSLASQLRAGGGGTRLQCAPIFF